MDAQAYADEAHGAVTPHDLEEIQRRAREAGKLLLVDTKIVDAALDRTLASHDLVKETINAQELIFMPHLKRAEEVIAGRIKSLAGAPSTVANQPAS